MRHARAWVGLDTRLAGPLWAEAQAAGMLGLEGPARAEVAVPGARLDFAVGPPGQETFVEVKCASLVVDGTARFPDAPTARGVRHAQALARLARRGHRAEMAFVIVRPDAEALAPHAQADPMFARALRGASRAGVRVRAFRCEVGPREARVAGEVPVRFGNP